MSAIGAQPTQDLNCPGCGSRNYVIAPASRRSGRAVAGCKSCGCHWLTNPPAVTEILDNQTYDREVYESYVNAKRTESVNRSYRSTLKRIAQLIESDGRALFDVGAGSGEFLVFAREDDFEPYGNELSPGAIELAKEHAGIDLHFGDLATSEGENLYDAITMWCVLAHVTDPDELLRDALRVLKPGGILFLQTPRWSGMDTAAWCATRASGGRLARVLDRRVNEYHMTLNSVAGLTAQTERQGFEVVDIRPRARYTLRTHAYLTSLGMSPRTSYSAARILDTAVDRDLFFRNVLDLYARKPMR